MLKRTGKTFWRFSGANKGNIAVCIIQEVTKRVAAGMGKPAQIRLFYKKAVCARFSYQESGKEKEKGKRGGRAKTGTAGRGAMLYPMFSRAIRPLAFRSGRF
ncbi:hypothetical protein [Fournierella sp.]|uniref:hypothetical protein n=1 Tax=Allofournierella sp. TaxID=1940256 RepID=UPI0025C0F6D0|nr:hypothetical protein [Fournierella sp.]